MSKKTADAFESASNTIDTETAIKYVESQGYTCVQADKFTDARLNMRMFYLNPTEINYSMHAFMGMVLVFCIYRFFHLRARLCQLEINNNIKNKKK